MSKVIESKITNPVARNEPNLMAVPHIEIGQTFVAKGAPRLGDGGIPRVRTYLFEKFGPRGLEMRSGSSGVVVDQEALMRKGIIHDPSLGDLKVVETYVIEKAENGRMV